MKLPKRIGKYEIVKLLGEGSSKVYLGKTRDENTLVVIKTIHHYFDAEAECIKTMSGTEGFPTLVEIFDYHIVVKYTAKTDIALCVNFLSNAQILDVATKLSKALVQCKAKGIIHRDIKGDNVIYNTKTNTLEIIDFGWAYIVKKPSICPKPHNFYSFGTPVCNAPEFCYNLRDIDFITRHTSMFIRISPDAYFANEVFSFGVILCEMLIKKVFDYTQYKSLFKKDQLRFVVSKVYGEAPFENIKYTGSHIPAIIDEALTASITGCRISANNPLIDIVKRCTQILPQNRPTIEEVAEMLGKYIIVKKKFVLIK